MSNCNHNDDGKQTRIHSTDDVADACMHVPDIFLTSRLALRTVVQSDAEAIFNEYGQDPVVTRFLTWQPYTSLHDVEQGTLQRIERHQLLTELSWMITAADGGRQMGMICLRVVGQFLECGYILGQSFWNRGFATEALQCIASWNSRQADPAFLWACCDIENIASARVLEKAGFIQYGVLHDWSVHPAFGNQPRNCFHYVCGLQAGPRAALTDIAAKSAQSVTATASRA